MRSRELYQTKRFTGVTSIPAEGKKSLLVLLHGVGANEEGLVEIGELLEPDSIVVSLRAPIQMGPMSYAWFHVQFTPTGPVHVWTEAERSFELLQIELMAISEKYKMPLARISVMGFSQGAIMAMGLALRSNLGLSRYYCFSGRTLPEFAQYSHEHPEIGRRRKVYLAHGTQDEKLPIQFGKSSKEILETVRAEVRFNEFPGGHQINHDVLKDAANWGVK